MSLLSTYRQIRFSAEDGQFGTVQLVINRPGFTDLTQPDADTLLVFRGTDGDYAAPFLESDFALSKKFTTTKGRRAIDDVSIQFRDGFGYKGTVDGSSVNENFLSIYQTFFDVWFNDTRPYKAFILTVNDDPAYSEVSHEGWIDPTYKPSSDPYVVNPNTATQIWCGSRTLKITALSQAQISLTWQDILQPYHATLNPNVPTGYTGITASDCQEGVPYAGFVLTTDGNGGKNNTRADPFSSSKGNYYQAVPFLQKGNADNPDILGPPPAVWPSLPWITQSLPGGIAAQSIYFGSPHSSGYVVGDTGTIDGGTVSATYEIRQISLTPVVGEVFDFKITFPGDGYTVGTNIGTVATTGVGTNFTLNILRLGAAGVWGPSGTVFISIGTLFAKIVAAMGLGVFTPSTDLQSALGFWAQKYGADFDFPIDISGPIALDNLWISLNVFAKCHPWDGSYWDNPIGWSPDTPVSDILNALGNTILADFNEKYAPGGTESLVLTAMGATVGTLPTGWNKVTDVSQDEPATGPRKVNLNNKGDNLKIEAPFGISGDVLNVEVPIRIRRIGCTGATTSGALSVDAESTTWDSSVNNQAGNCFQICWNSDGSSDGPPIPNPDVWKSLCYLYWFDGAGTAAVYPPNWDPFLKSDGSSGSWANSFYAVNACYKLHDTPVADLQSAIKGGDYFSTRNYHAVAFAALSLPLETVQNFTFSGIADDSGSVQNIVAGMLGTWREGVTASQKWRAIQFDQTLIEGLTTGKFQAIGGSDGFPLITDIAYAPLGTSGTSTSTGGGGTTGGIPTTSLPQLTYAAQPIEVALSTTGTNDDLNVVNASFVSLSATTGQPGDITGFKNSGARAAMFIINETGHPVLFKNNSLSSLSGNRIGGITTSDFTLQRGANITFVYDIFTSLWVPQIQGTIPGLALTVAANINDWAIPYNTNCVWVTAAGNFNITGVVGGYDGRELTIYNLPTSPGTLTIVNLGGPTPDNQFQPGGNIGVGPNHSATFRYSGATTGLNKWLRVSFT